MRVFGPELNESLLAAVARGVTLSTPREASVLEFFAGAVAASGRMCSLEGGLDVLPRALADRLDVRLGARVTGVQRDGAGVRVHLGSGQVEHADACVLTTSFVEAVELYPALSTTSCAASAWLHYKASCVGHAGRRRSHGRYQEDRRDAARRPGRPGPVAAARGRRNSADWCRDVRRGAGR